MSAGSRPVVICDGCERTEEGDFRGGDGHTSVSALRLHLKLEGWRVGSEPTNEWPSLYTWKADYCPECMGERARA